MQVLSAGSSVNNSIPHPRDLLRTTCLVALLAAILALVVYVVAAHMRVVTVRDMIADPGMNVPVEAVVVKVVLARVFQVRFLVRQVSVGAEVELRCGRMSLH